MFGIYKRKLDEKNRVLIPTKLRDQLSGTLFLSLGPDNIIELRNSDQFNKMKEKLINTNSLNSNVRILSRIIFGNTFDARLDNQNRIILTNDLIIKTGITKNITFVGVGSKIEIWPTKLYEEFEMKFNNASSLENISEELSKEGVEL